MDIRKSVNRIVSLLLALAFIFTNTAYSAETKLRVPLQLQTEAGQSRAQETMDAATPREKNIEEQFVSLVSYNLQDFRAKRASQILSSLVTKNPSLATEANLKLVSGQIEKAPVENRPFIINVINAILKAQGTRASTEGKKLASNEGVMSNNVRGLLENIKGVLDFDADGNVVVVDVDKLRSETIDYLAVEAALSKNNDVKAVAQFLIRSAAISLGIIPASINDFYMARKDNVWGNMSVPAVNIRTDGYETSRQIFRVVKEQNIGAIILELAKSEMRYSAQNRSEFTAVGFAAAIKEGYMGPIFFQGDHYQIDLKKYTADPQKEINSVKKLIRESILAGEYNIDLDPSTLVNEEALDEIVAFENVLVSAKLRDNPELAQGLDETGLKALRNKMIDELVLTDEQRARLDALYETLHADTAKATMELIRYIRGLETELLGGKIAVSIGIEERHIDNPKHKNNPSTVRGSIALSRKILKMCADEGLVGPSKIALQTGTMHGVGGKVDFGIYERHTAAVPRIGIAIFVQHGASTIKDRNDFRKMPIGGVGEVHLATEYQKITLGTIAKMMPDLAEQMAQYLEKLMADDPEGFGKKFGEKWAKAFSDPAQQGKTRQQVVTEILADELPGKLQGSLKDLTKELPGPFKNEIWNIPGPVREASRQALYKEFSEIFQMLGASETRELIESIISFARQPVILAERPEALTQAMKSGTEGQKLASNEVLQRATEAIRTPVIGGNWKMDKAVATKSGAEGLLRIIIEKINMNGTNGAEIIVAVPIAFLGHLHDVLMEEIDKERLFAGENASLKGKIKIAAQNIAGAESGAQTGRSSVLQVKDLGATHVIIGHSEQIRDSDGMINDVEYDSIHRKVKLAVDAGLVPIVCVGENLDEREAGETNSQIKSVLKRALSSLTGDQVGDVIIAYEPVWAIGTGKTATPEQAEEVLQFIRGFILERFGEKTASKVRIIYGGSVKPDNIAGLMDKSVIPNNDGALVGGASLKADSFMGIVKGVPVKLASNQTADNINVKIEHATLLAEEGIRNPEGFKRLISRLLDNPITPIAVAVVAAGPEEIDALRTALIPADFDTLKGRGVKFSVLDMSAIKDAKAQYPDSINIQEGFEVFSITANLRDYDRLIQTIDQGV